MLTNSDQSITMRDGEDTKRLTAVTGPWLESSPVSSKTTPKVTHDTNNSNASGMYEAVILCPSLLLILPHDK
jgi:hypothetical protein